MTVTHLADLSSEDGQIVAARCSFEDACEEMTLFQRGIMETKIRELEAGRFQHWPDPSRQKTIFQFET